MFSSSTSWFNPASYLLFTVSLTILAGLHPDPEVQQRALRILRVLFGRHRS